MYTQKYHPVLCANTYNDINRFGKWWDGWKYKRLNILKREHNFPTKSKNY